MRATKTTKVYDKTLEILRRLTNDSSSGLNQAQIIGAAVVKYAVDNGYAYCMSGIVTVGDKVKVDNVELMIKLITDKEIVFSDNTDIAFDSGLAWRMEQVND